jgi:hypothetical protein
MVNTIILKQVNIEWKETYGETYSTGSELVQLKLDIGTSVGVLEVDKKRRASLPSSFYTASALADSFWYQL